MSLQQNLNAFLGAAVLGVIGAAGLFLVDQYRQEKMRNKMAKDLARLDKELATLRNQLQQLQSQRSNERFTLMFKLITPPAAKTDADLTDKVGQGDPIKPTLKANSILSTTTDDYLSASNMDSSDLEFYDLSDDEIDSTPSSDLDLLLIELDKKLDLGNVEEIEETLQKLEDLCIEHPENAELLYRIGKAHHKVADRSEDKEIIKERLAKGSRTDFVSIQEKISDGHLFRQHVDKAISINPNDASLHYMLGRFDYEVAGLKWYERKLAAAVYGEPPNATYEEACAHFLEAERLANFEWKDNKLMLAKCKIAMGEYREAVEWLEKASRCKHGDGLDDKVDKEIKELLEKYSGYR